MSAQKIITALLLALVYFLICFAFRVRERFLDEEVNMVKEFGGSVYRTIDLGPKTPDGETDESKADRINLTTHEHIDKIKKKKDAIFWSINVAPPLLFALIALILGVRSII